MSAYGKLVVKVEVLDPSITGDEEDVYSKKSRMVTMFARHGVTRDDAQRLANAFIKTNIPDPRLREISTYISFVSVMWYPNPVEIEVWR